MKKPRAIKPTRADKEVQASVLAHVRQTAPEDGAEDEAAAVANRFGTTAVRTTTLLDGDVEYCVDVMDEDSERVWHIAAWPKPPGTELEVSHCFVVGSKEEARDVHRSLTGAPAFVANKQQQPGTRTSGYVGRGAAKPGRTQQKQG